MSEKKGFHYAWVIFIGCCCCGAGGYGAIFNVVAVYALPICQSLDIGVGDWMLWLTVSSICSCIMLPFWGKWMQTKNFNVVTTIAALLAIVPVFMFSFGTSVAWYLFWGGVMGCGLTCIGALVAPTLIGNWFGASRRGRFLGVATAFTGLGAFVFAPLFTQLVQSIGWHATYLINGAISAVLILPFTAFLFKLNPSSKGLLPYGATTDSSPMDIDESAKLGVDKKTALRSVSFYILAIMIICISIGGGFTSNMVAMTTDLTKTYMVAAEAAILGGWMVSASSVGDIISKVLFGFMVDKFGTKPTFTLFMLIMFAAFALWALIPQPACLIVGAFLFGMHKGIVSVGFPIIVRQLFGNREYSQIFSTVMTVNALMGGLAGTIVGYIYQLTNSYLSALYLVMLLIAIAFVCLFYLVQKIKTATWNKVDSAE